MKIDKMVVGGVLPLFNKLENESLEQFILRLSEEKIIDKSITWQGIADSLCLNYGILKSEAWVRGMVRKLNSTSYNDKDSIEESLYTLEQKLDQKAIDIKKERAKLSDQRAQLNADVRKISREETIKEIAFEVASQMSRDKLLPDHKCNCKNNSLHQQNSEAILCISDWHYGLDFKNPWNEFNPEICKERINKLKDKSIQYIKRHGCKKLYIVNLGDLIAGRIHLTIRLESKYDVITQTLHVSEMLAEFINDLSNYVKVDYYDCIDNHSRLEPDKKASQDLESLARIIPWYLKERLKNNSNVSIKENQYGHDLITFKAMGFDIIGCHGDKDPIKNIDHLSMMTEQHYDMLLTAHEHHFQCDEKNRCIAIGNSSLMGVDSYAQKLRLSSTPSQNLIIVTEDNVAECIYRITL